jgi:adenosylmethionine-8-amino-7-oxononanoate aminotransferase
MKTDKEALSQINRLAHSIVTGQVVMPQLQLAQIIIEIIKETENEYVAV